MSISWQQRSPLTPRLLWHLSRPYFWSYPPGWDWGGPAAQGRAMTLRGAGRAMARAERRLKRAGYERN